MNPLGMSYSSVEGVIAYAGYTGMLVTGRENRYHEAFQEARKFGAEIIGYLNPTDVSLRILGPLDAKTYAKMQTWPYPTPGERKNYYDPFIRKYYPLADMRAGSDSIKYFVDLVAELMMERRIDGVLLDVVGEHAWTKSFGWDGVNWNWPQWEKDEWAYGNVDLVHRIDIARRQLNPEFIIINNNSWGDSWARAGEQFVNGRMIEHHPATSQYQVNMSKRAYGNPEKRRVLVLAKPDQVDGWLAITDGPTHIARSQPAGQTPYIPPYARVTLPPPCPFQDLSPTPP
jgi:hypothetical protein